MIVQNLKITLKASGTLAANEKLHYLRNILCGEALPQFDKFCVKVESKTMVYFNRFILGLGAYIFPVNVLSKKKRVMRHRTRNLLKLKLRCYTAHIIELNKYSASFPGIKASNEIGDKKLNKIILNSMPNGWSKQAYVQGFDCKTIT